MYHRNTPNRYFCNAIALQTTKNNDMEPIDFKQSNIKLTAPGSMPDCGDLPIHTDGKQCVSCWKLSFKERIKILFAGRVWLGVLGGRTQPPVWMTVNKPFIEANLFDHVRSAAYAIKDLFRDAVKMILSVPKAVRINPDKMKHAMYGYKIAIIAFVAFYATMIHMADPYDIMTVIASAAFGFLISTIAGLLKETYDRITGKGTPEWMDVFATMFGGTIGAAICLNVVGIVIMTIKTI